MPGSVSHILRHFAMGGVAGRPSALPSQAAPQAQARAPFAEGGAVDDGEGGDMDGSLGDAVVSAMKSGNGKEMYDAICAIIDYENMQDQGGESED